MTQLKRYDDAAQRQILADAKVIAVVGYSDDPERASNQIGTFLKRVGYKVYAVNPTIDAIEGEKTYPDLKSVPEAVDIVNVFRRSEHLSGIVDQAIAAHAKVVWAQLGVYDAMAAQKGEAAGVKVIMDNCIKVSYQRVQPHG